MARALKPLSEIANDACEMIGDSQQKKYHSFFMKRMAKGFQELHLFMTPFVSVRTEVCPYSRIINMKDDFVYPTKVGLKRGDKIILLQRDYNDNFKGVSGLNDTQMIDYVENEFECVKSSNITPFYNYNGDHVLEAEGCGIHSNNLYQVDENNGRILLGPHIPRDCEIVIEYKSDGLIGGLNLVPSEMDKALEAYGIKDYYIRKGDGRASYFSKQYDEQWYMLKTMYHSRPIDYYARLFEQTDRGLLTELI